MLGELQGDHTELLESVGFQRVEEIDLTPEFLMTRRAWRDGRERFRDELVKAEGQDAFQSGNAITGCRQRG